MTVTRELAERHYAEHAERPFFGELVEFITSGPIVAMVLEGTDAVRAARQVIGATDPLEAAPGTIRGDFAIEMGENMVHGSDSTRVRGARGRAVLRGASGSRGDGPRAGGRRPLVLASGSPQRRAMLERLGVQFAVRVPGVGGAEQRRPGERDARRTRSARRARSLREGQDEVIIGCDTVVYARRDDSRQAGG